MKRKIAFLLALIIALGMFAGCQNEGQSEAPETTATEPAATQSAEEQEVLRFLCIGNSHGLDAVYALYEVFQAEAPEKEVMIGALYYQGCRLDQHADWIESGEPNYMYYKVDKDIYHKNNGNWEIIGKEVDLQVQDGVTMKYALQEEVWDVVSLQQMNTKTGLDDGYSAEDLKTIVDHINACSEVKPELGWNMIWTNPDEEELVSTAGWESWKKDYVDNYQQNQDVMYKAIAEKVQKHIVPNEDFSFVVPAATAIHYAGQVCGVPDSELYRDYTHLSMTSRVIAAYMWYAQLMGLEQIDEIKLDVYPKVLIPTKFKYLGDITLTQEQKDYILKSVNHALANPYEVPAAQ